MVGKTASCAAMALTFAFYAVPGPWWAQRTVAVVAVLGLAALNYRGVTRTAFLTRILVATSLIALTIVVIGIFVGGRATPANLGGWGTGGVYGTLQVAGLLFFAFAGYARIATMGEDVRDPQRTIPRAIPIALFVTVAVYVVVATVDLRGVIGFSSFGVLIYYVIAIAIANAVAFTQPAEQRRWPRWLNLLGVIGCVVLVATLPWQSAVAGVAMFAVGLAGRAVIRGSHSPSERP